MLIWEIRGRSAAALLPDWRHRLAERLGQRPRRIGMWAELALSGALDCLEAAGESRLADDALLSVCSLTGPEPALLAALATARHELPLPIGFLQGQPGQVLPVLAQYLGWAGNGRCLACRDPVAVLRLACAEADAGGVLAGWADELPEAQSLWLRAVPRGIVTNCPDRVDAQEYQQRAVGSLEFVPGEFSALFEHDVQSFSFDAGGGLRVARYTPPRSRCC